MEGPPTFVGNETPLDMYQTLGLKIIDLSNRDVKTNPGCGYFIDKFGVDTADLINAEQIPVFNLSPLRGENHAFAVYGLVIGERIIELKTDAYIRNSNVVPAFYYKSSFDEMLARHVSDDKIDLEGFVHEFERSTIFEEKGKTTKEDSREFSGRLFRVLGAISSSGKKLHLEASTPDRLEYYKKRIEELGIKNCEVVMAKRI